MALRDILVKFTADTSDVKKKMGEGSSLVDALASKLTKLGGLVGGAFAVGKIVSFTNSLLTSADAAAKTADALGMGIQEWQGWAYAAEQAGVKTEAMFSVLGKIQKGISDTATKGAGPAAEAFRKLGIEVKDSSGQLRGVTPVLDEVIDQLAGLENTTERNGILMGLFGEQGARLNPLFSQGAEGVRKARAELDELGFAFSDDFARQSEDFGSNLTRLERGVRGLAIQVLGPLLPYLIKLSDAAVAFTKVAVRVVRQMRDWTQRTAALEAALTMLTVSGVGALAKAAGTLLVRMGGLKGMFLRMLPFIWKVVLPFLALEDIWVFLMGGSSALGKAIDAIFGDGSAEEFRQTILKLFEDWKLVLQDIRNGDLGAALEHAFSPVAKLFAALGEMLMQQLINLWDTFVEKSGGLGVALGLKKFSKLEVESAQDRNLDTSRRLRGGQETDQERAARQGHLPGASDLQGVLGDLGPGLQLMGEQTAEGIKLLGAAVQSMDNWVETARLPDGHGSVLQDINVQYAPQNQVSVTVPPGTDADLARRTGASVQKSMPHMDLRAVQDALVPVPGF